jgi:hypothetical protein
MALLAFAAFFAAVSVITHDLAFFYLESLSWCLI